MPNPVLSPPTTHIPSKWGISLLSSITKKMFAFGANVSWLIAHYKKKLNS